MKIICNNNKFICSKKIVYHQASIFFLALVLKLGIVFYSYLQALIWISCASLFFSHFLEIKEFFEVIQFRCLRVR